MSILKKGLAVVLAAATVFTFAPAAVYGVAAQAADVKDTTEVSYTVKGAKKTAASDETFGNKTNTNTAISLDTVVNKTTQISVANTSAAIYYMPEDSTVVSTNPASGTSTTVTALKSGSTNVKVTIGKAHYTIPVQVSDKGTDVVKAQVNGKDVTEIDLDASTSTAANAIKSVKITGTSQNNLPVAYDLYDASQKNLIAGNSNAIASVSTDGTVTAGKSDGTVYVKVYTSNSNARNIDGDYKWVKIVVNKDAEAIISAPSVIRLDFKNNTKVDLSKIVSTNAKNATVTYTKKAYAKQNVDAFNITGKELQANQIGEATLVINVGKGTDTRATSKEVTVSVVNEITKAVPVITVKPNVRLTVGSTSALGATTSATGAAITYTSDNNDVASVDATGIVTAKSAGIATITVKSAATADFEEGVEDVTVIVDPQTVPAAKPATVKNVKVKNAKGAKVSVSWTSQGGNILYRVYKKVGNSKKWTGKNVTSAKTTLSVKKGARVTIKVKAYVKDSAGKITWGPKATTAKAFKTDRK